MDSHWTAHLISQEHAVKCTVQISSQNTAQLFGQLGKMVECFFKNQVVPASSLVALILNSDFAPAPSKEFLDIQASIECGFTLNRVRDMKRTCSQMHHTGKCSEHSSILLPVWAKWLSVRLKVKWFYVRVQLQSLFHEISHLLRARSCLTFRQL